MSRTLLAIILLGLAALTPLVMNFSPPGVDDEQANVANQSESGHADLIAETQVAESKQKAIASAAENLSAAETEATQIDQRHELKEFGDIVVSAQAQDVAANVWCMALSDELRTSLEENPYLRHSELFELSPPSEFNLLGGENFYSGDLDPGSYFVWAESPGYSVSFGFTEIPIQGPDFHLNLEKSPPLKVRVEDQNGNPMAGAKLMFFGPKGDPAYMDWGWRKRLEASFFLRLSETGPDGRTELLSPLSASNMFEVSPMAGLCGGNNLSPSLDKENLIVLTPACSVKGRVVDADNKVVANSYVGFMGARQGQEVFLTSTPVDQEGNYSIAVVPANFDQLQAIGFAEGYTLSYQTIARPQAGGNYQHDFVIHKAVALACYLHADGEPVANAEVFFAVDELEDVPGFYRTDKNGNLTTDRVFRANTQYQLQLVSGSARLGVYPFTIPENQQEVLEIEVDPVGTLVLLNASTDSDEQIVACRFRSQSGHAVGFTEWDPRQGGGPLVPVGQGRLVCRTAGGSSWSKDLNVRSGVNQIQTIIRQAPLTFTLPETEDVGNWKIGFYTDGDTPDRSVELLSGQHEVQVSPGSISFQIESPDGNSWQLGPVAVREDGFDLGVLAPQAGTIIGRVVDENGQAWAGLQVSLVDVDMRPEARAFSDAEGRFAFNQIPFGFHSVHLRPRRSLLLNSPDQHLDVHVTNGAPVEIEMVVQADSSLRGKVIPAPQKPTEVWAINANTVQEQSLSPSGDFAFSTMAAGWVLAGRFEEGKVFLVGEKVNGDQELLLDFSSCEELNLDFADVSGKPAAFARVQFEVVGSQLAGSASLNEHGQLSLSYSPALPLVLVVNTNNYGKVRYPLAKLIQGSKLTLDGKAATLHPVVVRTLDGNMLNYATISNRSLREVWHTNNAGTCLLPENSFSDELRFEYSGYWTHILRQISQTVVMRKTIAPIEITYPGSISVDEVVLIPVFDLGYEFPLNVSPTAARTWQISGIPEGRYVISALDRAGVIVDQREEKLSSQTGHNIVVR